MGLRDYIHYFRNEDEEQELVALENYRQVLEWTGKEYHKKFLKWLEVEASKPFEITSNQLSLVQSAVRANTLREIQKHLIRLESDALAANRQAEE